MPLGALRVRRKGPERALFYLTGLRLFLFVHAPTSCSSDISDEECAA